MFRAIVVGTDGSAGASKAVLAAAELAATQPEAVLHIVTVQKPLSPTALAAGEMAAAAPVAAELTWEDEIRAGARADARARRRHRRSGRRHPDRDPRPLRQPRRGPL